MELEQAYIDTSQSSGRVDGTYDTVIWEDENLLVAANGKWEVKKLPVMSDDGEYFAIQISRR